MDNRQQRDQYGQQSGWGQQGRQQDQWRDGGEMDSNYNTQQASNQNPSYGEVYHGNLKQREEETNRARGHNYGHQAGGYQGGMFQGRGQQQYGQEYNPGGYGQVGNTGGGHGSWNSYGSSDYDMGGNYDNPQGRGSRGNMGYDNRGSYGQQGGYGATGGGYGQQPRRSDAYMGNDSDRYNRRSGDDNDQGNRWWDRAKSEVRSWFNDDDDRRDDRRTVGNDHGNRGEHWGKGPRGYNRSEDRIREDICERLAYDGQVDASDIEVKVEGSEVILTGTVRSRSEKRRAEDLVDSIMGVRNVENRIRVDQEHSSGSWTTAGTRGQSDSNRMHGDSDRSNTGDSSRATDSDRYGKTSGASGSTTGSGLENRSYTGNSGDQSGIGNESGTTNEIIRNSGATDTKL